MISRRSLLKALGLGGIFTCLGGTDALPDLCGGSFNSGFTNFRAFPSPQPIEEGGDFIVVHGKIFNSDKCIETMRRWRFLKDTWIMGFCDEGLVMQPHGPTGLVPCYEKFQLATSKEVDLCYNDGRYAWTRSRCVEGQMARPSWDSQTRHFIPPFEFIDVRNSSLRDQHTLVWGGQKFIEYSSHTGSIWHYRQCAPGEIFEISIESCDSRVCENRWLIKRRLTVFGRCKDKLVILDRGVPRLADDNDVQFIGTVGGAA